MRLFCNFTWPLVKTTDAHWFTTSNPWVMKTLHQNIKIASLLLSFIFLFQSCHVYKSAPISLEEAVTANRRVKIITVNNEKIRLTKIEKINDTSYYGYKRKNGKEIRFLLKENNIQKIKVVDKTGSTIITSLGIAIPVAIIISIIVLSSQINNLDFED